MIFFRPFDILILGLILLGASVAYSLMDETPGTMAEVYVSNRKAAVFTISGKVEQKEIPTRIGKVKIQFGQGTVKVIHSPCNQKICILQGEISRTFEHIICLPAQLQIVLISTTPNSTDEGIDAVTY